MRRGLDNLVLTLKYSLFDVHGYHTVDPSSFVARSGCVPSDMFRIRVTEIPNVSLAQFQASFLLCPLFQLELWLLSNVARICDPVTTTNKEHLLAVANGHQKSFGPWTATVSDGNRFESVRAVLQKSPHDDGDVTVASACQIMRSQIGKDQPPFCDTWWAVECTRNSQTRDEITTELVFGSHLIDNGEKTSSVEKFAIKAFDPLHRLYSRLLLSNAKATLVQGLDQQQQSKTE